MCRIKVLDGFQFEACLIDLLLERGQFLETPELVRVAGQPPAGVVADGLVALLVAARGAEIIHQMNYQVSAAALPGEAVMLGIELMFVESETEFHDGLAGSIGVMVLIWRFW